MFPIDVLMFSEFRTMRNHLSETLMLNDIQITSDYMSRWVVLKRRVGAVTSQRVLKALFYINILQCFFVVDNFTANAVSVAIGDNGNRLIFEIWWNFFYDLFLLRMLLMLISSIPLLANGIWRNFLLLSWRGSDRTGLKRRRDATSHIILDNLYLGKKGSTPPLSSPKSLRSLR
jgi:hypothetical protein